MKNIFSQLSLFVCLEMIEKIKDAWSYNILIKYEFDKVKELTFISKNKRVLYCIIIHPNNIISCMILKVTLLTICYYGPSC